MPLDIDWSRVPSVYEFVAIDKDGDMFGYTAQPVADVTEWIPTKGSQSGFICNNIRLDCYWTAMCYRRPQVEREAVAVDRTKIDKPFGELDTETQNALFQAWRRGATMEYSYVEAPGIWSTTNAPTWSENKLYRVEPAEATKPSIDWSHVAPGYKWLARDEDGRSYLFDDKPTIRISVWLACDGIDYAHPDGFASYAPGTCDWKDSLVERPEGV